MTNELMHMSVIYSDVKWAGLTAKNQIKMSLILYFIMDSKISAQATLLIYITIDRLQYNELQCK